MRKSLLVLLLVASSLALGDDAWQRGARLFEEARPISLSQIASLEKTAWKGSCVFEEGSYLWQPTISLQTVSDPVLGTERTSITFKPWDVFDEKTFPLYSLDNGGVGWDTTWHYSSSTFVFDYPVSCQLRHDPVKNYLAARCYWTAAGGRGYFTQYCGFAPATGTRAPSAGKP